MKLLKEGKAKKIFISEQKGFLIQYFKDDATAFNSKKKDSFEGKGILNNKITSSIFTYLNNNNIQTHFIKKINDREQLVKELNIIPLEVVMRNLTAGSFTKRLGQKRGEKISPPILEYYLKSDALNDPLINKSHILYLKLASKDELEDIENKTILINKLLSNYFNDLNIDLVDFKLEYGKLENNLILADEISPDNCRLWDKDTKQSLDKDLYRNNTGNILTAYKEVLKRIENA